MQELTCAARFSFTALHLSSLHWTHCTAIRCTARHAMYCTVHCSAVQYNALNRTAPHCTRLHFSALYYTKLNTAALFCTALHFYNLHYTALHHTVPHRTAPHCIALHCTELLCTVLQFTALHFFALHCNAVLLTRLQSHVWECAVLFPTPWLKPFGPHCTRPETVEK